MLPADSGAPLWPFRLEPILKQKVWGGDRLSRFPSKGVAAGDRIGESWEASGLPGEDNVVATGPCAGERLSDLTARLGTGLVGPELPAPEFPLLVKFLDARERLSLQVHPPTRPAPGGRFSPGKAEAWFILEGGELVSGLAPGVQPAELESLLRSGGDPTPLLCRLQVRPGDTVPIAPGTLHCIGPGVVLAELQQPADITYRLHDWGRAGRDLHLPAALEVLDPQAGRTTSPPPLECRRGANLFRFHLGCRHFGLESASLSEPCPWVRAGQRVEVLLALQGAFAIGPRAGGPVLEIEAGQTAILPALTPELWLEPRGTATVLVCYPSRLEREHYDRLLSWGYSGADVAGHLFPA